MSRPRVLVVRSGGRGFAAAAGAVSARVEIVEKVSHAIEDVDTAADAFARCADLTIVTSQTTVERLFSDARLARAFRGAIAAGRIAAVGSGTAAALTRNGVASAEVAEGSAQAILETLPPSLTGVHVLLPCGEDAAVDLAAALEVRGAEVLRVPVYRKIALPLDAEIDRQVLAQPFVAYCATSPAAARWLFAGLSPAGAHRLRATPAVALGPSTRQCFAALQVARVAASDEATFASAALLLEALATGTPGK